jgi:cell division protein ZapA (FtsZ GTPase activity inhibitor)
MRSYTVSLGGHTFQIRSDADAEHVKNLTDEVARRFALLDKKGPRGSQEFRAMSMVAIVLLDELMDMARQRDEIRDKAREFAENLIGRIDDALAGQSS